MKKKLHYQKKNGKNTHSQFCVRTHKEIIFLLHIISLKTPPLKPSLRRSVIMKLGTSSSLLHEETKPIRNIKRIVRRALQKKSYTLTNPGSLGISCV